jgi:capsule polysaccharide export protein KpsE/RkpR
VSIETLKQELSALDLNSQRQLTAFLVSLQDARSEAYRRQLAEKIDRPASEFATLEELDRRLGLSGNNP